MLPPSHLWCGGINPTLTTFPIIARCPYALTPDPKIWLNTYEKRPGSCRKPPLVWGQIEASMQFTVSNFKNLNHEFK